MRLGKFSVGSRSINSDCLFSAVVIPSQSPQLRSLVLTEFLDFDLVFFLLFCFFAFIFWIMSPFFPSQIFVFAELREPFELRFRWNNFILLLRSFFDTSRIESLAAASANWLLTWLINSRRYWSNSAQRIFKNKRLSSLISSSAQAFSAPSQRIRLLPPGCVYSCPSILTVISVVSGTGRDTILICSSFADSKNINSGLSSLKSTFNK